MGASMVVKTSSSWVSSLALAGLLDVGTFAGGEGRFSALREGAVLAGGAEAVAVPVGLVGGGPMRLGAGAGGRGTAESAMAAIDCVSCQAILLLAARRAAKAEEWTVGVSRMGGALLVATTR
jgi:hypothetical protein